VPFSRNPQVRLTGRLDQVSFSLTAYSQRDFTSPGPDGNSNKYLRNSCLPGLNLQVRIAAGESITGWAGIDYKRLRPELKTSMNFETRSAIGSISAFTNIRIKTTPVNMSLMGAYGQNASDLMMIGGYAVSEIISIVNDFKTYTPLSSGQFLVRFNYKRIESVCRIICRLHQKILGAKDEIAGAVYGRGPILVI